MKESTNNIKKQIFKAWQITLLLLLSFNLYAQTGFAPFKTESGGIDLKIFGNGVHQLKRDPGQAVNTSSMIKKLEKSK